MMRWLFKTRLELYEDQFEEVVITILPVLRALEQLKTRVAKLSKRLARN